MCSISPIMKCFALEYQLQFSLITFLGTGPETIYMLASELLVCLKYPCGATISSRTGGT